MPASLAVTPLMPVCSYIQGKDKEDVSAARANQFKKLNSYLQNGLGLGVFFFFWRRQSAQAAMMFSSSKTAGLLCRMALCIREVFLGTH